MNIKKVNGFTLAETVVFVGSFSLLAVIATATLFIVLGNLAKTRINQEIRRNGDNAIQIIERHLKIAREITRESLPISIPCGPSSITFIDQYGAKDNLGNPTGSFSCQPAGSGYPVGTNVIASGSGQFLTDPSRVTVVNCQNVFSCDLDSPIKWIRINFRLAPVGVSASTRTSEMTSVGWNSQINIRYQ